MFPFGDGTLALWLACCSSHAAPGAPLTDPPWTRVAVDVPAPTEAALRTFVIPKSPGKRAGEAEDSPRTVQPEASNLPKAHGLMNSTVGMGYVQHADWGAEALATGTFAGLDLQLDSLFTFGSQGARIDHGTLSLRDAENGWRADAGDLFSDLRGPVRGVRLSWQVSDRWQPAFSIDRPPETMPDQRTLFVYRDHVHVGPLGVDAEVASDASHFLRTRFASTHLDLEASYRRARTPVSLRDQGLQAELRLWHGVALSGGWFVSDRSGERSEWRSVGVHVPVYRGIGLTLERNFSVTSQSIDTSSAAMVNVSAGRFMFFHRYQWGRAAFLQPGAMASFDREQLHSMASWAPGTRVNFTLQVATQWTATGRAQEWLELQSLVRLTRRTHLEVATPIQAFDSERFRVRLDQGLPRRFSVLLEYGRPASYQDMQNALEQPRFKVMLRKTWDVPTPARGAEVRGLVLDYIGRPVPGARVKLGPYATDADASGAYVFPHVPNGEFDLALDPNLLPADYAWDGRARHLTVKATSRLAIDLVVAPLNAIHGRVYADRNGNGQFDSGEQVSAAVVCLEDRLTVTDATGTYDFYNVLPGAHVIRLDATRLPGQFEAKGPTSLTVELREDRPVTGADFLVAAKTKPVIWREIK